MVRIEKVAALTFASMLALPACASTEGVEKVASLRTPRAAHTATALPSGGVLIVGGMSPGGGSLGSVEWFDPAVNRTREVDSLGEPRASHSATLLDDGTVVIAGGYDGEYLDSVELFDPATKRFRSAGTLAEGRSGHTATLLRDGRVLLAGGVGRGWTFLRSAEVYDPRTGRSEAVGSMAVPRESHTATLLDDGGVLIVGGHSGRRQEMIVYASAEIYQPESKRFAPAGALETARHKHDAVKLHGGRVLVIGGADRSDRLHYATTEILDPVTRTFNPGPSMSRRRYKIAGTTVLLPNGDALVTSGADTAEIYQTESGRFRDVRGRFPEAYRFAAAAILRDGDVIITGGYSDGNQNTAGIWRFRR